MAITGTTSLVPYRARRFQKLSLARLAKLCIFPYRLYMICKTLHFSIQIIYDLEENSLTQLADLLALGYCDMGYVEPCLIFKPGHWDFGSEAGALVDRVPTWSLLSGKLLSFGHGSLCPGKVGPPHFFLPEASSSLWVLSLPASVSVCVRVSITS